MGIGKIFMNKKDGHLRSGLQIAIAAFSFLFISMFGQGLVSRGLLELGMKGLLPQSIAENYFLTGILPEVIFNFVSVGVLILLFKVLNKKRISEMGIKPISQNMRNIGMGIITAMLFLTAITGLLLVTGNISFTGVGLHSSIIQYTLQMISVSLAEEVLNRGYIQSLVKKRAGVLPSIIVPSLVFLLFHMDVFGKPVFFFVNVFLAGVFFSIVTEKTGNIWFSFGAHLIWNLGGACIFGLMEVSSVTGSILNFTYLQKTVFNGFGVSPLNGVIGTIGWIVMIVLFAVVMKSDEEK